MSYFIKQLPQLAKMAKISADEYYLCVGYSTCPFHALCKHRILFHNESDILESHCVMPYPFISQSFKTLVVVFLNILHIWPYWCCFIHSLTVVAIFPSDFVHMTTEYCHQYKLLVGSQSIYCRATFRSFTSVE